MTQEPDVEIIEQRFAELLMPGAKLEKLYGGMGWAEGPVWFADTQTLLFSDIPNDRMLQWCEGLGVREFRRPSNFANGHTRDRQGRLVSCEHQTRRVTRTEPDGTITVLADAYLGKRLNSPNDVVVQSCSGGAVFAVIDNGFPDGFRFDAAGNLWTSAGDGIHCFAPDGVLLGKIAVPETVANLTFGGPARDRMFITATTALYAIPIAQSGAQRP